MISENFSHVRRHDQLRDRYALIEDAAARAAVRTEGASIEGEDPLARRPATELQIRLAAATRELRRRGHPADRP
jgi:hypothetical protein